MNNERLIRGIVALADAELRAEVQTMKQKLRIALQQRDDWHEKARSYKEYASKYQRQLAEMRRSEK